MSKKPLKLIKNLEVYKTLFDKEKKASHIDLKKVNRIRKAIAAGRYQIDYAKLADKILAKLKD